MTSIDLEFPPVPQLSPADEIHVRQALRRNRLLATGLLALMVVIAIATRFVPSPAWLVQLIRAGAEAGIIGGLADWFAITVLFRLSAISPASSAYQFNECPLLRVKRTWVELSEMSASRSRFLTQCSPCWRFSFTDA